MVESSTDCVINTFGAFGAALASPGTQPDCSTNTPLQSYNTNLNSAFGARKNKNLEDEDEIDFGDIEEEEIDFGDIDDFDDDEPSKSRISRRDPHGTKARKTKVKTANLLGLDDYDDPGDDEQIIKDIKESKPRLTKSDSKRIDDDDIDFGNDDEDELIIEDITESKPRLTKRSKDDDDDIDFGDEEDDIDDFDFNETGKRKSKPKLKPKPRKKSKSIKLFEKEEEDDIDIESLIKPRKRKTKAKKIVKPKKPRARAKSPEEKKREEHYARLEPYKNLNPVYVDEDKELKKVVDKIFDTYFDGKNLWIERGQLKYLIEEEYFKPVVWESVYKYNDDREKGKKWL